MLLPFQQMFVRAVFVLLTTAAQKKRIKYKIYIINLEKRRVMEWMVMSFYDLKNSKK